MALAIVVALTWAPVVAAGVNAASSEPDGSQAAFTPSVTATSQIATTETQKFADTGASASDSATLVSSLPKRSAPAAKKTPKVSASVVPVARKTTSTRTTTVRRTTTTRIRSTSSGSELSRARAILASLIAKYPIIAGATVSIGSTPGGYQAICYYKSARIIVNPNHTASLSTILNHEVWHIIDWRDNGRIDWGEAVPR